MKTFKSKIDIWIVVLLVISIAVPLVMLILYGSNSKELGSGAVLMIFALVIALPLWLFTSTKYVVNDDSLRIQSGPFRWNIPVKDITSVSETRNPISSPALSLDRLKLQYGEGKSILVSPREKFEFLEAIGHPGT